MTRAGAANAEACLDGRIRARSGYAVFSWAAVLLRVKTQRPRLPSAAWAAIAFAVVATVAMTLQHLRLERDLALRHAAREVDMRATTFCRAA